MRLPFTVTAVVCLLGTACDSAPARIRVGRNDTLVVHASSASAVPITVMTASGRTVSGVHPKYEVTSGSVLRLVDSTGVQCTGRGDATLRVSAGGAASEATVRCRPIEYIHVARRERLIVGGDAVPLDISAVGTDGQPLTELAVQAVVRDTTVAVVRDGRIHPRQAGRTVIELALGCRATIEVTVAPRAFATETMAPGETYTDTVSLAAGEHRFWKLAPGRYDVTVVGAGSPTAPVLSTFAAACREASLTPGNLAPGYFECTARPGGAVILRNPRRDGRIAAGRIDITRSDGPPSAPASPATRIPPRQMCAERFGS
jgi:hypothetical protein